MKEVKGKRYIKLKDLEVYRLAREMGRLAWEIYEGFDWRIKKIIGDQFIQAVDSVGANIAEGYGRYHYLDRVKFFYNARASLLESQHWIDLIGERNLAEQEKLTSLKDVAKELHLKINRFIKANFRAKKND